MLLLFKKKDPYKLFFKRWDEANVCACVCLTEMKRIKEHAHTQIFCVVRHVSA